MTNENVLFPDRNSSLSLAATLTTSNSPAPTEECNKISRKPLKKLENGGVLARVSAWLDDLPVPSPTHNRPISSDLDSKYNSSWMLHHPSALQMFEQIISAAKGKQIVMFLDYDGTLSPIVQDPNRAFMSAEMRAAVRDVARYIPTAIVTGRCRDKVYEFVRLAELYYAGSHGMDIKGPVTKGLKYKKCNKPVLFQPAHEFLPMIDQVYKILVEQVKSIPGAMVENNKYCLSVHFRCVEEKKWDALAESVRFVMNEYPKLRLTHGRKVLEIRPTIDWDKGRALEFLLESLGYGELDDVFPVYIGDDKTDEDAFKVLRERGQGFGILVSNVPKETNATYSLQDPSEVMHFLQRLVEWQRTREQ